MKKGLYEQIVNLMLNEQISQFNEAQVKFESLNVSDSHSYLSQYMYNVLCEGLQGVRHEEGLINEREKRENRLKRQVGVCNEMLAVLEGRSDRYRETDKISLDAKRLLAILEDSAVNHLQQNASPVRPDTPLAIGSLFTGRKDPSLISQLKKEIETADSVDILCSFIKWTGIRILEQALRDFTSREGATLRVITTSYMGATDIAAIKFLAGLPNTEIKVSYDTRRTRLHAKAYLIHRKTGFSSAYIGSSNISKAALTEGLEWNIKISEYEQKYQWKKLAGTFETYWNDSEFESYSNSEQAQQMLSLALQKESGAQVELPLAFFIIRPYAFQQEILEQISSERLQGRSKHLIVAATGTGKTMIAAFDFKKWRADWIETNETEPRFLFVAHRKEILQQALSTFRQVLRDPNFGDIMVGGILPTQTNQLFVSVQTFNSQQIAEELGNEHYDYVIIDEFHHAAATSYRYILDNIAPKSLLGLTATPERMDGFNVVEKYFDGHTTAELRLPDAINRGLLCPFQYFGITDTVDYRRINWQRGRYQIGQLENVYTANDVRVNSVLEAIRKRIPELGSIRGLGFCVSQRHAEFMAERFSRAGLPSDFLTAQSDNEHRNNVQQRLLRREINLIFVVDLYNEGVDIPEIDTVLFLRPTESLTVFLQQLGRGLRICEGKECLTVLDFIGQHNAKYRFAERFKAISANNDPIERQIKDGFGGLPLGCNIDLERKAEEYVLENIRTSLTLSTNWIVLAIRNFTEDSGKELTMPNFLAFYGITASDIYKRASWNRLLVSAGLREEFNAPNEVRLTKGLRKLCFMNDGKMIDVLLKILTSDSIDYASLTPIQNRHLFMLCITLWTSAQMPDSIEQAVELIRTSAPLYDEVIQILEINRESKACYSKIDSTMTVGAEYTRDQILCATGYWTIDSRPAMREGVLFNQLTNTDAFFITLEKNEEHYSPTTMYDDYAISETLFHWQSQSTTSETSPTGQRYISRGSNVLLFVREKKNANGIALPYHFLGSAQYVSHEGSRPMSIVWRLHHPIPARLLRETKRLGAI